MQVLLCGDDWNNGVVTDGIRQFLNEQQCVTVCDLTHETWSNPGRLPDLDACICTGTYAGSACSGSDLDEWLHANILDRNISLISVDTKSCLEMGSATKADLVVDLNALAKQMRDASETPVALVQILSFLINISKN